MDDARVRGHPVSAIAAVGGSNVSIPLSALIAVLSFGLSGTAGFLVWIVKQITLQSRFQAETVVVLKGMSDRAVEDRQKLGRLEDLIRERRDRIPHTPQGDI